MVKRYKKLIPVLISSLLAVTVMGCGKQETQSQVAQPNQAAQPTQITVALDWYPNAVHSFLYAAEEQGYFKEENLQVQLQMPSDANDPLKMAAAGQVDAAISYQTQVIQAKSEGVPVVSIAGLVYKPLNTLMVRQDSGIKSPKDLAGKTIGYPSIVLDEKIVQQMVQTDGGDPTSVTFADIGYDIVPALTSKKVDAVIGGYINHEKLLLEKNGVPVTEISPQQYGVPTFYELVLATSNDTVANKRQALEAFLRAAKKGQEYVASHKETALQTLLAKQAKEFPLEQDVEIKSLDILLPLMKNGDKPFGVQDAADWQTTIDWMKQVGLLSTEVKVDEVMNNLTK